LIVEANDARVLSAEPMVMVWLPIVIAPDSVSPYAPSFAAVGFDNVPTVLENCVPGVGVLVSMLASAVFVSTRLVPAMLDLELADVSTMEVAEAGLLFSLVVPANRLAEIPQPEALIVAAKSPSVSVEPAVPRVMEWPYVGIRHGKGACHAVTRGGHSSVPISPTPLVPVPARRRDS